VVGKMPSVAEVNWAKGMISHAHHLAD
jgi:hypothetical protein